MDAPLRRACLIFYPVLFILIFFFSPPPSKNAYFCFYSLEKKANFFTLFFTLLFLFLPSVASLILVFSGY